jgi:fermentation-respiration switch protein FrsA (DUF1100 family)
MILFGRSLGGAVAVDLATRRGCAGMILESTFTSAKDMSKMVFGPLPYHLIMKTRLNADEKIVDIRVPVLFVHGNADNTVPFKLGKKLFALANEPKQFYEIQSADHNNTYVIGGKAYFQRLFDFIEAASHASINEL